MHKSSRATRILVLIFLTLGNFSIVPAAPPIPWASKVDPWVSATAAAGETEFIVFLAQQADLSGAAALQTKLEKGTYVFERLREVAERTQKPLLATLQAQDVSYRPYWVANMIWVRGDMQVIQSLAARADVAHIYANPRFQL